MTITTCLVCDDVRREANGKMIIIGAYLGSVGFTKLPATFGPIIYFEFSPQFTHQRATLELGVRPPGEAEPSSASLEIEVNEEERILIIQRMPAVQIDELGMLTVVARLNAEPWTEVRRYEVNLVSPEAP